MDEEFVISLSSMLFVKTKISQLFLKTELFSKIFFTYASFLKTFNGIISKKNKNSSFTGEKFDFLIITIIVRGNIELSLGEVC